MKSGWAAVVLTGGSPGAPVVLDAQRIELADPGTPASIQPYHAGFGRAQPDQRIVNRLIAVVKRRAEENVGALLDHYRTAGRPPVEAAVVGTSTIDPATIANPHIRIHALEGQLFRQVVEDALVARGVRCRQVLEQQVRAEAPHVLRRSAAAIQRTLSALRPAASGPWRAEQKAAALAAWVILASRAHGKRS